MYMWNVIRWLSSIHDYTPKNAERNAMDMGKQITALLIPVGTTADAKEIIRMSLNGIDLILFTD